MSAAIPNDLIAKPAKAQSSVIPPSNSLTAERARDESKKIVSLENGDCRSAALSVGRERPT